MVVNCVVATNAQAGSGYYVFTNVYTTIVNVRGVDDNDVAGKGIVCEVIVVAKVIAVVNFASIVTGVILICSNKSRGQKFGFNGNKIFFVGKFTI